MFHLLFKQRRTWVMVCAALTAMAGASADAAPSGRTLVYRDNYDYASQKQGPTTTFNTWMWREDCNGNHEFQDTHSEGCSAAHPCVKLTTEIYDAQHAVCHASQLSSASGSTGNETPYINAEMYNNACVRQGAGHPQPQPFDALLGYKSGDANPWVQTNALSLPIIQPFVLYEALRMYCDRPYPYDPSWQNAHPVTPYARDSWNTTTPGALSANPLAYFTAENAGMWFRDLAWNTPYLADATTTQSIEMSVRAEGDGGGTRGWGFWNTTMVPTKWQFAWFMEFTPPPDAPKSDTKKLLAMTVTPIDLHHLDQGGFCVTPLPDDVYRWRDYSLIWSAKGIEYRIDGRPVARHAQFVPDQGMAFHNWVDNRNYSGEGPANFPLPVAKSNFIRKFEVYEEPAMLDAAPASVSGVATVCKSWQFVVGAAMKYDPSPASVSESAMAQEFASRSWSLGDLTGLLMKLGLI